MNVMAVHRDPFSMTPNVFHVRERETLAEMTHRVTTLPEGWPRHDNDVITINGEIVPRGCWHLVRPHSQAKSGGPVEIAFYAPPMGGDGGGKNVLSVVATIGLLALSGGIAGGAILGGLTGASAATGATLASRLVAAAVLIGGSSVLQALAPTPSRPQREDSPDARQLGSAAAQGNILEPNAPLPRVIGTRKIYPPFVTEPLVYFDGEQEVVEILAALAGPHKLDDIRIDDAPISDMPGVFVETREGWPGLSPLAVLRRYARTTPDGSTIRGHLVSEENKDTLETLTGNIEDALPQAKVVATRNAPDEFWIGIQFGRGLAITTDQSKDIRVPLRIRVRQKNTAIWINFPELHFQAAQFGARRATVKFIWRNSAPSTSAASAQGWVEARTFSPGQAITPFTTDWQADSYFDADTGADHYVSVQNASTTDVIGVVMDSNVAQFELDRSTFPPGIYEIEITRGYAFQDADYDATVYEIDNDVRDPFYFEGASAETIFQTRENLVDELTLVRSSSVWNDQPVKKGDTSLIAIRARDIRIERLSVLASGYVQDYAASGIEQITNGTFNTDLSGWGTFAGTDWSVSSGRARLESADGDFLDSILLQGGIERNGAKDYAFEVTTYTGGGASQALFRAVDNAGSNPDLTLETITGTGTFSGTMPDGYDRIIFGVYNGEPVTVEIDDVSVILPQPGTQSGWSNWTTTSNPAAHIIDALVGQMNATPLPQQVIDYDSLVDFREAGWTCNAILEGTSVSEAVKIMAGSGYAQLYQSDKVGVVRDRDRSADAPVQVFTPRNSAEFSWSRGYAKLPDGFRATFADIDSDYEAKQIIHPRGASRTEQVQIEGLVTEAKVRDRLQYDLDTARLRSVFYSWNAASDAIKCRRGSLVGLVSDALSARLSTGRVVDYDLDASGDVTAVQLDNTPDLTAEPAWASISNLNDVDNMALIGATFGIAVRRGGKTVTTHEVTESASGDEWVDLATPAALPGLDFGDLYAIGPLGEEYRRLLVIEMRPRSLTKWEITAVPEAPELWQ